MKTFGEEIGEIIESLEGLLWRYDAQERGPIGYSDNAFRGASKVFMSVLMDKMWQMQKREDMPMEQRVKMVEHAGEELRKLIKEMTGIDTHNMYK